MQGVCRCVHLIHRTEELVSSGLDDDTLKQDGWESNDFHLLDGFQDGQGEDIMLCHTIPQCLYYIFVHL